MPKTKTSVAKEERERGVVTDSLTHSLTMHKVHFAHDAKSFFRHCEGQSQHRQITIVRLKIMDSTTTTKQQHKKQQQG